MTARSFLPWGRLVFVFLFLLGGLSSLAQKIGDINRDGSVTVCDASLLLDHLHSNGLARLTTNNLALPLADTDTNGFLSFADFQRLVDMIVGRAPEQDFDLGLLSFDDGDGFSYLEDWHYGTNPYMRDTDGDGIEDEVDLHTSGAVHLAQPPVDVLRFADEDGFKGIVLAQPPVDVLRASADAGLGIVLAQPPVDVLRASNEGGLGVVVGQPPVDVLRMSQDGGLGVVLGQPPLEVIRP